MNYSGNALGRADLALWEKQNSLIVCEVLETRKSNFHYLLPPKFEKDSFNWLTYIGSLKTFADGSEVGAQNQIWH